ncbi:hypothetical protein PUN28_004290 [Cardiocondyla obscurior]|uniref:Uncharacterized protein n=1 Tax=Cardiocondyla obscurior TaxID=286306 RepID=A0AAW2GDW2_9HYME
MSSTQRYYNYFLYIILDIFTTKINMAHADKHGLLNRILHYILSEVFNHNLKYPHLVSLCLVKYG